jgi:predicted lipoprotein with Yx(FWY)xxD motif
MIRTVPFVVLCALIIAVPSVWANSVQDGVALCAAAGDQQYPQITSDGAGGDIVTWQDGRSGNTDIYAQRVNASGAVQWTTDGVALCTATGTQRYPTITSDGGGGAIVTWEDCRSGGNYHIYAQRVNASGAVQWTTDGVALCTATGTQRYPTIISDGAGDAIVTWEDLRSVISNYDIYAQRVNASGAVQWTANGIALCTATGAQWSPTITSDGAGGSIVTWWDNRNSNWDIYVQRVNASGAVQWTANGVALCTATENQSSPKIASDGAGGAIVTWSDDRSGDRAIYAQRVNGSGAAQWTKDGVALCTATGGQLNPKITSDGACGAIVTWEDYRSGEYNIYTQRVNASGGVLWRTDGLALCTAEGEESDPTIVSDSAGGAIVTWMDLRGLSSYDIYAQRVDASGAVQWTTDGVPLCAATGDQTSPAITSDGAGGVIVTWQDYRSGTNWGIYGLRVKANGSCALNGN